LKKSPDFSDAYIALGTLFYKFHKPHMAKKYWQKAAQTAPQSSKARAFVNLSSSWSSDDELKPAMTLTT